MSLSAFPALDGPPPMTMAPAPPPRRSVKRPTAAAVKEKFEAAKKHQSWEQQRHKVARAYLSGDQYVYINGARGGTVEELARTNEDRARLTDNRMASATRTLTAKLLQRPLVFEVIPTASDDATIRQARTAEAVAIDVWDRQRWETSHRETAWRTMWEGGTAVLAVEWDRTAGQGLGTDDQGRPVGTGDVKLSVLSVAQAYTEPGVCDIETAAWWIKAEALPPKLVQVHYKLEKEPKSDTTSVMLPSARREWARAPSPPELVMVYTYYERPGPGGDGVVATVVGDQVVAADPWPFPWSDHLNCVAMRETVVTDRWCGESILWQAPSLQNAINAGLSNVIEHLKYVGNVRGITPDSNMEFLDELTDLPGEWLAYASTSGKPEYLSPPSLPAWITGLADRMDARMDDLLGTHAISRGSTPANIESGVGLSVLLESDTTPVGLLARRMADGFSRIMSMCLELLAANVTETRTAKVRVGRQTEEWSWTGADIGGQTKASIPVESVVPKSHEATRARALEMVKLGLIKSVDDYELYAEVSPRDRFSETINPQVGKARRENFLMGLGRPVLPREFDDHALHIKVHNGYRSSQRYEESSPDEQAMADDHVQAHEMMAAEDAAKKLLQMAQSPALAGAPEANEGAPLPAVSPGGGGPLPAMPTPDAMPPELGGGGESR